MQRIPFIDSHTGGEPTRVILTGGPEFPAGSIADHAKRFHTHFNRFRTAVVTEPRGSEVLVGALLLPPSRADLTCGVLFFNNVGVLGMCGHGTIGLMRTLAYLGRISPGEHRIETPVGEVGVTLHPDHRVSVRNVVSYRLAEKVRVEVPELGVVTGDVAWGGNWFFLVAEHDEELHQNNIERLTAVTWAIRQALSANGITGKDGSEIDHIELFGPPRDSRNRSRNFVLCPGKAYDRSPCGTGTSAKLACLAADGKLLPGQVWRQESIIGSVFEGSYEVAREGILPTITGTAFLSAEGSLLLENDDPFIHGIDTAASREPA